MRRKFGFLIKGLAAVGVLTMLTGAGSPAFASMVVEVGKRPGAEGSGSSPVLEADKRMPLVSVDPGRTPSALADISRLSGADETDQYVVVLGNGMDSKEVQVGYYKKDAASVWQEVFLIPGQCGLHGMAADKKEGDKRTPTGVYQFTQNFGILEDPGSVLPYKQVNDYDFWVDDGNSRYYNQMVNSREVAADWTSAEPLSQVKPAYNYALALNYNTDARTPGKGSAIFLHGLDPDKDWTSGCIAIPEEQVKLLVQEADADTRIAILPEKPTATAE